MDRIGIDAEDEREKDGMCKGEEAGIQETWLRYTVRRPTLATAEGYGR